MNSCKTCDHRKCDDRRGGPVCGIYNHSVKDVDKYLDCEMYKKKQVEEEKV